jgi:hypothetical protein
MVAIWYHESLNVSISVARENAEHIKFGLFKSGLMTDSLTGRAWISEGLEAKQ